MCKISETINSWITILLIIFCGCTNLKSSDEVSYALMNAEVDRLYLGSGNPLKLNPTAYNNQDLPVSMRDWQIFANDTAISNLFLPPQGGIYQVWAVNGNIITDTLNVVVRDVKQHDLVEFDVIMHILDFKGLDQTLIEDAFENLNNAFDNKLGSLNPNAQSAKIHFNLASHDENGNPLVSPGIIIEKVYIDTLENKLGKIVRERQWNPDRFINVWISDTFSKGWSDLPYTDCTNRLEGLKCLDNSVVKIKNGVFLNSEHLKNSSDTFIHEIGHFFGLFHVFTWTCERDNDFCSDTPMYVRNDVTNKPPSLSCNQQYFVQDNHMDYSGERSFSFTYDQVERMRHVVTYGRYCGNIRELAYIPF